MTTNLQPKFKSVLKSGFAYGAGLLLGNALTILIFQSVSPEWFLSSENQGLRLLQGILLAFVIAGLGGFLGGCIGGFTLPSIGAGKGRWGYAWRSGITFGFGYGILIFPLVLILTLLSFYDISSTPAYVFSIVYGFIGVVFGVIMGLSLGAWTIGRRFPPITRYAAFGFGCGGLVLGYTLWVFIFAVTEGQLQFGPWWILVIGFFLFAGLGGAALGKVYHQLASESKGSVTPAFHISFSGKVRRWAIIGAIVFALLLFTRPLIAAIGDLLTPVDAALSPVLDLPTTGTHWLPKTDVAFDVFPAHSDIASGANGRLALAWVEDEQLRLQQGQWASETQQSEWQAVTNILTTSAPETPQLTIDNDGQLHLLWISAGAVQYSRCREADCTTPITISPADNCKRQTNKEENQHVTVATDGEQILAVWENNGVLPYALWSKEVSAPPVADGCVPTENEAATPRLADSSFDLIYATDDAIMTTHFGQEWMMSSEIGSGKLPEIYTNKNGVVRAAWCDLENQLAYFANGEVEIVAESPCETRPILAEDSEGHVHLIWYDDKVVQATGVQQAAQLLFESIKTSDGWSEPALIDVSQPQAQAALTTTPDQVLHLVWDGIGLHYAAQVQYQCDPADLTEYGRILYDIARDERYLPADDPVPYCQNRYDQLLITPNPDPAYSDAPAPANSVYDTMGDLIRSADYEVLYSTMWYATATNHDSPGSVIATAVADLYQRVKANPAQYPRGMTVRIMLGNPPELATGDPTGQLWSLIGDLRHAGIDKMVDDSIGWRLEVADFEGNLPHSHVKTLVIDGKHAAANGFNMTYDHFPTDHISGQGKGRFDLGLLVTGPAAQATQRMFDDMWAGADQRYCLNLNPPLGIPWQATCLDKTATADHVPEVQKFYLADADSTAFSMYRSKVHDQADQQTVAILSAAQQSIDAIHVNFALDMICSLNILFEICNVDISPDYMEALLTAAQNGTKVRILIKPGPFEGIENQVALDTLAERMKELGIEDQIELRYFNGPVHPKAALIDDQMLIVGSQNFHYSAFGTGGGLTEYSFAVEDPQAVLDYQQAFEYQWERATPAGSIK